MIRVDLLQDPFEPAALLSAFMGRLEEEGAVVSFVGRCRGGDRQGGAVDRLILDHHPRLTRRSMMEIAQECARKFDVSAIEVVHRCGAILPGEAIVWVAAASKHRRAAFDAADYLMDRLKTEAVFWKREEGSGGSTWIEPTDEDYSDRARWE